MASWLPLTEFSSKYNISVSTLRRRIRDRSIQFELKEGKYFILEEEVYKNQKGRKPIDFGEKIHTRDFLENEEVMVHKLLEEIKRAYSLILTEKEEQISLLKEEISDLKTLIRVLESENERLNKTVFEKI